jgi:hypothetical protein
VCWVTLLSNLTLGWSIISFVWLVKRVRPKMHKSALSVSVLIRVFLNN